MAKSKDFLESVFVKFDSTDDVCTECFKTYDVDRYNIFLSNIQLIYLEPM